MKRASSLLSFLLHVAVWRAPPVAEGFATTRAARSRLLLGGSHKLWWRAAAARGGVARAAGEGGAMTARSTHDATDLAMAALRLEGWTLQKIGDRYGITRERVRQRLKRVGMTGSPRRVSDAQIEDLARLYLDASFVVPDDADTPERMAGERMAGMRWRCNGGEYDAAMQQVEARVRELGLSSAGVACRMRAWSRSQLGCNLSVERRRRLHESIAHALRGGASLADVARSHGVSLASARLAGQREGALPKVRSHTRKFRGENSDKALIDAEIAERLARGELQYAIAAALGVSQPYVSKRARVGRVLPHELDATIRARLAAGAPQKEIAAALGLTAQWLSRRIDLARLREPPDERASAEDDEAAERDGCRPKLLAENKCAAPRGRKNRPHAAAAVAAASSSSSSSSS